MARVVLLVLSFAITIYAMADCVRTPSEELPARLPKALWLLVILLFTPIGGIAWIIITRVTQAEARGGQFNRGIWYSETPAVKFPSRQRTEAPIDAPDNDPEFLWKLEKELQRKRREGADANSDYPSADKRENRAANGVNTAESDDETRSMKPDDDGIIEQDAGGDGSGNKNALDEGTDLETSGSDFPDSPADAFEIDELDPFPDDNPDDERPAGSPQTP